MDMNFSQKKSLVVIEVGHLSTTAVAGGDLLIQGMAPYLKEDYWLEIIIPSMAMHHWRIKKGISFQPIASIFLESSKHPSAIFFTYLWRATFVFFFLLRKKGAFILCSSTNILPDVFPAFFARYLRKNVVWVARIHHLIPLPYNREGKLIVNVVSNLMQSLALFMIRARADIIIALNENLKEDLIAKGYPIEKTKVLGAGINFEKINTQKILKNTKAYDSVFLGRLHPTKGVFDLIPIWDEVVKKFPQAQLAVIGGGQEHLTKSLQKQIDKAGLSKNVFILGYLPIERVYSTMERAKVFLFTDHEAGWGLAVAEAMAAGLPVVGYDIGILGTVYKEGFKKVPLGNHKAFAREIKRLLKNENQRLKLAKEAKKQAAKLDWAQTSKNFRSILKEINV